MYYRWNDRRIVVKIAVWGATEGTGPPFVHTLADAAAERVDAGELEPPDEEGAVGIARNAEAVSVDEDDRRFTMTFLHPAGDPGTFRETPVDYKLVAPEAPVDGNRAFASALHETTAVILIASGDETADAGALEAVDRGLETTADAPAPALHVLLAPEGSDRPDPTAFRDRHALPETVAISASRPWNADEAWRAFLATTRQIRPHLEGAAEAGRLPV